MQAKRNDFFHRTARKLRKLRNDPARFMQDSQFQFLRALAQRANARPLAKEMPSNSGKLHNAKPKPALDRQTIVKDAKEREHRTAIRHSCERFKRYFGTEVCDNRPFVNFGAGSWSHPFFQNVDLEDPNYPKNRPDIPYDAFELKPVPLPDSSTKLWYFCHVNEHLPDRHNEFILTEILRILEPGGVVRVVYPDLDVAHSAYLRNDREFFLHDWWRGDKALAERFAHPTARLLIDFFATRAQAGSPADGNRKYSAEEFETMLRDDGLASAAATITSGMSEEAQRNRPGCHINYWNFDKWKAMTERLGFVEIERSAYLQSRVPPLRDPHFFDRTFPHMSGYVEFRKPA